MKPTISKKKKNNLGHDAIRAKRQEKCLRCASPFRKQLHCFGFYQVCLLWLLLNRDSNRKLILHCFNHQVRGLQDLNSEMASALALHAEHKRKTHYPSELPQICSHSPLYPLKNRLLIQTTSSMIPHSNGYNPDG